MIRKCNDKDISEEEWKQEMNKLKISTSYKNDIYKFLKSVLNYGSTWYNFNFASVYNKMTNFKNPNERRKKCHSILLKNFKNSYQLKIM